MNAYQMSELDRTRALLRDKHRRLAESGAEPGTDRYTGLASEILDATERLLDAEAAAADAGARRRRAARARRSRAVASVTAGALLITTVVCLAAGWASPLWLVLSLPVVLGSAWVAALEPAAPGSGQDSRDAAMVSLAAAALLTAAAITRVLPGWVGILAGLFAVTAPAAWLFVSASGSAGAGGPEQAAR